MRDPRLLTRRPWRGVSAKGRGGERFYRERYEHERVVRSTHGVNCTGSCSWQVHVKDGLIAWETQQTDYPENDCFEPDYEPRGCPRGASFSWYVYSPLRVRHPYVRGALLERWRDARGRHDDPADAWAEIAADPAWREARGKGGLVRSSWDEAAELVAAAVTHSIERYGPDRVAGFSPIPAMSMASFAGGARYLSLIGGTLLSFYDWYCDLPPASPQVWGDQTDVPESADWYRSSYVVLWGSNVPMTRTPDAHFLTEARYAGQKVAVVSPDYSQHVKFADTWLPARAGTDGALAMAMGHVILKEFHADRTVERFEEYARRFTDLPYLVRLEAAADGDVTPGRLLTARDLGHDVGHPEWKPAVWDARTDAPAVPNGSIGHRHEDEGRWNLDLEGIEPELTFLGAAETAAVRLAAGSGVLRRGVPVRRVGGALVTTVYDLLLANYGVRREGLPGDWPESYDDPQPFTPAWQEQITGVDRETCARVARELAENAERTGGRSLIVLGAGVNHWYHGDTAYRAILALLLLTGCQGVNGGGWAHYVGQEKVRPVTGLATVAFGLDWAKPPRHQPATPFWYLATDQWRYDAFGSETVLSPLADGAGRHMADVHAQAARLGWLPSYPQFDRSPLGLEPEDAVAGLQDGTLRFACEDPDAPENWPRVLFLWRANLLGASSKGHEYFMRHLLGTTSAAQADESERRPEDVTWHAEAPRGKLDLLVTLDFRMSGSALYSDVVLPAATWYEKHDISSTDMHPFVHPFQPAVAPQWEAKEDWEIFKLLARETQRIAGPRLGVQRDLVASALQHDSPDEIAQNDVLDWRSGECEPVPGRTMPKLVVVERDYGAVYDRMTTLGPLQTVSAKGIAWEPVTDGLRLESAREVCDTILALSGTTNAEAARRGWRSLERQTGQALVDLVDGHDDALTFEQLVEQPRRVLTSPEWSGIEHGGRRYSPFTLNVERLVPWRTLTGRQHFYLDHPWMRDYGEALPVYRPPLELGAGLDGVVLRYLTPHSKWSVHSTYSDVETLLTLFRGGPAVWLSPGDAERAGLADNDWLELANEHGKVIARAVVSHRIPAGVAVMYHAQDRSVAAPRGSGTHNSLTKIVLKPTHMIGGWAQLSYGFNYYGPIGSQRDELCTVRRLEEVHW